MRLVILCGGSGLRLWPLSRKNLPKQFISLFNGRSLLDLTIERVLKFSLKKKPIFICNENHSFLLRDLLIRHNISAEILLEPEGKGTCAAIYLAAKHCCENENLLIMPSDHLIDDNISFTKEIFSIDKQVLNDNWVTLGVKPTKPSEAYGYIQITNKKVSSLYKVNKFIEKPSSKDALKFIKNNNFFWNAGIFFAKTSIILKSIQEHASDIAKSCDETYKTIKNNNNHGEYSFSPKFFSTIPQKSIDYAVMENAKNIYLYPLNSIWNDVGSWDAISETNKINLETNNVVQIESNNNFIKTDNRVIATIQVNDLIIVDTNNATLITKKEHSEKVKLVV
ncbi:sugar phosphate nucleotidyltransferase, partial [Alphaproteobacteria bacterium]|nr:sugar phosphate nucleotidyltransferase [Alphaproteobacteria bacterium]